MIIQLICI